MGDRKPVWIAQEHGEYFTVQFIGGDTYVIDGKAQEVVKLPSDKVPFVMFKSPPPLSP